jgi:osmotically-inducible protein OsmY
MPEMTPVERAARAALEREPATNLHRFPIRIAYDAARRVLALEGEVADIVAKRRAFEIVRRLAGVDGVTDRLRVHPAEARGDGAIRASVTRALLSEPVLRDCAVRAHRKGLTETLRAPANAGDAIDVTVHDGVVELTGRVGSLSHKRLVGALAWWAPGCRDVRNETAVVPPEADSDDEVADALRLVLEKDPLLVHADDIGVRVRDGVVTLAGAVPTAEERRMAEFDAWYVLGVRDVVNRLALRH